MATTERVCEHIPGERPRLGPAAVAEGICPTCAVTLEREAECGRCPCCGVGWSVAGDVLTMHFRVSSLHLRRGD